jgi:hypothetical protein
MEMHDKIKRHELLTSNINDEEFKNKFFELEDENFDKLLENINTYKEKKADTEKKITPVIQAHLDAHDLDLDKAFDRIENVYKKGIFLGDPDFDEHFKLLIQDFVIVEALSNHGKSTSLITYALNILKSPKNKANDPMVFYYPFESTIDKVLNNFVNALAKDTLAKIDHDTGKMIVSNQERYNQIKEEFNYLTKNKSLVLPNGKFTLDKIKEAVSFYCDSPKYKDRTKIFIFDYIQIIKTEKSGDVGMNWLEKDKLAEDLASLAVDNGCIVIAGCQLTEKLEIAQAKSIYHSVDVAIRLFNHSHPKVKNNNEKGFPEYIHPNDGRMIMSKSLTKTRRYEPKDWEKSSYLDNGNYLESYRNKPGLKEKDLNNDGLEKQNENFPSSNGKNTCVDQDVTGFQTKNNPQDIQDMIKEYKKL